MLSAYADFELTGGEMLGIHDHLLNCADCDAEYQSISTVKRLLGSLPNSRPKANLYKSLEKMTDATPVDLALYSSLRDLRRAFGLATDEENDRAMQQASGHAAGFAFALGMVGAWFAVAPVAFAPVAGSVQARHLALAGILHAAGWPRRTRSEQAPSWFGSSEDTSFDLADVSLRAPAPLPSTSPDPAYLPESAYNAGQMSPEVQNTAQDAYRRGFLRRGPSGSPGLTNTQFYSVSFNPSP